MHAGNNRRRISPRHCPSACGAIRDRRPSRAPRPIAADSRRLQLRLETERAQNLGRIGRDLDAGADFFQFVRLLENAHLEAAQGERARRRQAADARTDQCDALLFRSWSGQCKITGNDKSPATPTQSIFLQGNESGPPLQVEKQP